jgi:uncharacterized protein (DUF1697 family)
MKTYIALLRGINVSGKHPIKMNNLIDLLENIGLENVMTYIQSGNIIFDSNINDSAKIGKAIEAKIKQEYGFDVPVLVRTVADFKEIYQNNPFVKEKNLELEKLHVTILAALPEKEKLEKLNGFESGDDEYLIFNDLIYLYCPNGYGTTKYSNTFFENKLRIPATTRNWKTVGKLMELADNL